MIILIIISVETTLNIFVETMKHFFQDYEI